MELPPARIHAVTPILRIHCGSEIDEQEAKGTIDDHETSKQNLRCGSVRPPRRCGDGRVSERGPTTGPRAGTTTPIKHVIVIIGENHSLTMYSRPTGHQAISTY
jgi:hypothetical protein